MTGTKAIQSSSHIPARTSAPGLLGGPAPPVHLDAAARLGGGATGRGQVHGPPKTGAHTRATVAAIDGHVLARARAAALRRRRKGGGAPGVELEPVPRLAPLGFLALELRAALMATDVDVDRALGRRNGEPEPRQRGHRRAAADRAMVIPPRRRCNPSAALPTAAASRRRRALPQVANHRPARDGARID